MRTTYTPLPAQREFERLYQRTRLHAYRLAYRLTGNASDAEDVTQDAYVRAWRNFDRFDASRSFEAWLFTILTHRALDLLRQKKRMPLLSLDAPLSTEVNTAPQFDEIAGLEADPQQIVIAPLLEEDLELALRALPATYREVIRLFDVEQCSYEEIAQRMHCAVGTVRSRMHRARRQLRHSLQTDANLRHSRRTPTAVEPDALAA